LRRGKKAKQAAQHYVAIMTKASDVMWKMREQGEQPLITWSKVTSAKPYQWLHAKQKVGTD
jgi:hypothetical protein